MTRKFLCKSDEAHTSANAYGINLQVINPLMPDGNKKVTHT